MASATEAPLLSVLLKPVESQVFDAAAGKPGLINLLCHATASARAYRHGHCMAVVYQAFYLKILPHSIFTFDSLGQQEVLLKRQEMGRRSGICSVVPSFFLRNQHKLGPHPAIVAQQEDSRDPMQDAYHRPPWSLFAAEVVRPIRGTFMGVPIMNEVYSLLESILVSPILENYHLFGSHCGVDVYFIEALTVSYRPKLTLSRTLAPGAYGSLHSRFRF